MRPRTVAISMIVGDDWRPEEIKALLASLDAHPEIKALYVNYNGTKKQVPHWQRWSTKPIHWERSDWNLIKPDVMAPGSSVRSSLPGNTYGSLSGTSMASPHVTGLGGILRQIRPDLTVNEFRVDG